MARGQPDFGSYQQQQAIAGLADVGELAARLGSINVYDRRGFTVWQDNFEGPNLAWTLSRNSGGTLPALSSAKPYMGSQSCYFVTAAGVGAGATIERLFPLLRTGKIGIEFMLYLENETAGYFWSRMLVYDGTNISNAWLRLDMKGNTAIIITSTGQVTIATSPFNSAANNAYTAIKWVIDTVNDKYVRLLINDTEFDISSHVIAGGGSTTDKFIHVINNLHGVAAGTQLAYLDNIILTQNEP